MEQRTIRRFRARAILIHWLNFAPFIVLLATGALMFFDAPGMIGARQIRTVHQVAAAFFIGIPVLYLALDPRSVLDFLKSTFRWNKADLAWLRGAPRYYSGGAATAAPQGYLNGDQKLWQLIVVICGPVLAVTGLVQWFFRLKIPVMAYQWVLLAHAAAFVVLMFAFFVHLYLASMHPRFGESLSSMLDGKISESYAREHYPVWYEEEKSSRRPSARVRLETEKRDARGASGVT